MRLLLAMVYLPNLRVTQQRRLKLMVPHVAIPMGVIGDDEL